MSDFAFPLLFRLPPSDASFAPRATLVLDNQARIAAPPDLAFDELATLVRGRSWLEHFRHVRWLDPDGPLEGRTSDQTFAFMTLRIRIVVAERGRRLVSSVDAASLPLAKWMFEEVTFDPAPGGGTDFRWRVHLDPLAVTRPLQPLIQPIFARMFRVSTARFAAFCAGRATSPP